MDAFCCRHDVPGVVFVCVCVCVCSFAGFTKRMQPPTFSDTAIADRHSDTTILQLRAQWVHWEKYHDELMFLKTKQLSISPFD